MDKVFFGGVPTEGDVKKLRETFKDISPGVAVTHAGISASISVEPKTSRYRTVVAAWRKSLMTIDNLDLVALPGIGYRCLTAPERVAESIKGFHQGTNKQVRSVQRTLTIRRSELEDADCKKLDHLQVFAAKILNIASEMMAEIKPPKRQERLPLRHKETEDS
jgi:hypothetical protein